MRAEEERSRAQDQCPERAGFFASEAFAARVNHCTNPSCLGAREGRVGGDTTLGTAKGNQRGDGSSSPALEEMKVEGGKDPRPLGCGRERFRAGARERWEDSETHIFVLEHLKG